MEYDCTKPLGDMLETYIKLDANYIFDELLTHGIVFESQFPSLGSMVCKQNASELAVLFSIKTLLNISYMYDNQTLNFVFYNEDKYSSEEANRLSVCYQKKGWNDLK